MKEMRASMKIPFVTFKPLEKELDSELRNAFERVYKRSWYIEGIEDENFEAPKKQPAEKEQSTPKPVKEEIPESIEEKEQEGEDK